MQIRFFGFLYLTGFHVYILQTQISCFNTNLTLYTAMKYSFFHFVKYSPYRRNCQIPLGRNGLYNLCCVNMFVPQTVLGSM